MKQAAALQANPAAVRRNKVKTFFSKPHNVILLLMGIVLTITTVAPIVAIVQDTFKIHPGTIDAYLAGTSQGYTLVNYTDLFTSPLAKANLWTPLLNTVLLSVGSCIVAILFGGVFAFLITRTNLSCRKYLSSIFIFPYIMPQWTLAVVWQNLFNSNAVTGTSNGLLTSLFNVQMPLWWCKGLFPSLIVLGMHYAPFAYILIGGIFRNMDANLEEAATILDTPKWKTMFRITLPMVKPAILSTILLVFGSSMGSYPVPHYLGLATLSTKYVSMNSKYTGEASILAIIMMIFGVAIMLLNQRSLKSRKNYTTVTGKSGQISKINLGRTGRVVIAVILIIITFFTSIFPIISFAFETFLPNPGDYSFLYTGDANNLTTKWWVTDENITDFLGVKKYLPEHLEAHDEVGLVNGMAWTSVGGVLMPLEVLILDGSGKTEFTGSLGDVMKESAKIAVSLTRSIAKKYNIDPEFWKTKDIHIHAPEGAVPKDGPSAGVTLTTALVSALSGTPVRRDVAMTGEITLRGKVLAIGGLKEKTMAAYRAGVKTVCIPKENEPDIDELDDVVKNSLKFVVAEDISTVLETALVIPNCNPKEKAPLKRRTTAKAKAEKKLPALTAN